MLTQYFDQKVNEGLLQYCKPEPKAECFSQLGHLLTTK